MLKAIVIICIVVFCLKQCYYGTTVTYSTSNNHCTVVLTDNEKSVNCE